MRIRIYFGLIVVLASFSLFSAQNSANAAPGINLVTTNLLQYYDYRNINSYPATGSMVYDLSGNGLTGNLYNSPAYTHNSSGTYLSFVAGSSQYQSVPSFNTNFSQGFSVSFRADFGANADLWERVFDFGNGNQSSNILMGRLGNSNDLFLETYGSSLNNSAGSQGYCKVTGGITANTVATYTMVIAANGASCQVYKDNIAQTVTFSGTDISPVDNVTRSTNYIGRSNWTGDSYFEGKIYSIAIYNRALTASEVTQNYNAMSDSLWPTLSTTSFSLSEGTSSVSNLDRYQSEASTFSLVSGTDSARFSVTAQGVLSFVSTPNYELPLDVGANNIYNFVVRALDSNGNYNDISIAITVTNVVEVATISTPSFSANPSKGITVTITVTPSAGGTAGKVAYLLDGKRIAGCYNKTFTGAGNSTCAWKPAVMGFRTVKVIFTPNGTEYSANSASTQVRISKRTTTR